MATPVLAHLLLLALWGGVVAAEAVMELLALRRPELARATATLHRAIDLWVEVPLLLGVLTSGLVLLSSRPLTPLLAAKAACGAVAVGANLYCVVTVVRRHREPDARLPARSRQVVASAVVGLPFALVALALGAYLAGWLSPMPH